MHVSVGGLGEGFLDIRKKPQTRRPSNPPRKMGRRTSSLEPTQVTVVLPTGATSYAHRPPLPALRGRHRARYPTRPGLAAGQGCEDGAADSCGTYWLAQATTCRHHAGRDGIGIDGQKNSALPLIKRGAMKDLGNVHLKSRHQRQPGSYDSSAPVKAYLKASPQVKRRSRNHFDGDVAPWVGPSLSDSSFTALMQNLPIAATCTDHPRAHAELQEPGLTPPRVVSGQKSGHDDKVMKNKSAKEAKARRRGGGSPRRSGCKVHLVKLPPVPNVTNLSFSRNFTFSFFDLPEHQSLQNLLQRQRVIQLLMKELYN